VIAHELGHGTFRLYHTFSEKNDYLVPRGTTDNLMDYNQGKELHKYQWDYIHDPQGVWFSSLMDEEEVAMVASGDSIKVEIKSFDSEFAPGVGKLELKYKLSESSKQIVDKYPDEDFRIHFAVADKNNDIVYNITKNANKEGVFNWNGYLNEEKNDSITYENGPYKLATTVTLGNVDIEEWQDIKDYAYELVFNDSVRVLSHSIDTSFNIIKGANLEWVENEDMQGWVVPNTFDNYKRIRDIYMTYDGVREAGNPFNYINENTKYVEFLGKRLKVHNEFATILETVKNTLKSKGVYSSLSHKYQTQYIGSFAMRTVNDPNGGGSVSEHGFGLAIDIYPKKNPQILSTNTSKRPYNTYVRFLLKQSIGFDIGESKTVSKVKEAHNKFFEIFNNTTISSLTDKYKTIYTYNNIANNIKIDSLQKINQKLSNIRIAYNNLTNQSTENDINAVKDSIESYSVKIKELATHVTKYKNTVIFDSIANNQIDGLKNKLDLIHSELLTAKNSLNDTVLSELESFSSIAESNYKTLQTEITAFTTEQKKLCASLYTFAIRLKSGVESIGFENMLLQDGFCDLELDIINAFLDADDRIQWGGKYNFKIDGMHFGFTSNAAKEIVNEK
jgi:hypothetical protein